MGKIMKRALLALLLTLVPVTCRATTVQIIGTLTDSMGNPLNGAACFSLPVAQIQDTSTSHALVGGISTCFGVTNGTFPAFASLIPNDVMQPTNLWYHVHVTSMAGSPVMDANYVIPTGGGTFNIGQATPTNVTTSQISYLNPVSASANNTFTGTNTFTSQIVSTVATGTPPFSIASITLVPNLNVNILNGVTVTGTPVAGQIVTATSPTAASWANPTNTGYKVECVNITPVTVVNTTSPTPLQGCSIPANDIGLAQTFIVEATGSVGENSGTGASLQLELELDSVVLSNSVLTMNPANGQFFNSRVFFTAITTGSSGTAVPSILQWLSSPAMSISSSGGSGGCCGITTINTTVSHTLQIVVTWGTADPTDTITGRTFTVYRIG